MGPKALVSAWVDAFNGADADRLAAFYAEDAINHQVAEAPVRGRDAIPLLRQQGLPLPTV